MTNFRLSTFDKFLLILSVGGIIGCIYLLTNAQLWRSYFFRKGADLKTIGRVVKAQEDVRRRLPNSLLWNQLSGDENLYASDTLYTGSNGNADIEIGKGLSLEMSPNSLVVLRTREKGVFLDLKLGNVLANVEKGQDFGLAKDKKIARIKGQDQKTRVQLSRGKKGVTLASTKGDAEVSVNNKTENITPKKALHIDDKMNVEKKNYNIQLLNPEAGEKVPYSKDSPLRFRWTSQKPLKNAHIQMAQNKDFQDAIMHSLEPNQSLETASLKDEGMYYWRIVQKQDKELQPISPRHHFYALKKTPPQPVFPFQDLSLKILPHKDTARISFNWKPKFSVSKYKIEVAQDKKFQKTQLARQVSETQLSGVQLSPGTYYWRIRSQKTGLNKLWSETIKFHIGGTGIPISKPTPRSRPSQLALQSKNQARPVTGPVSLKAPKLIKQNIKTVLEYAQQNSKRKTASSNLRNPPQLKWTEVPAASAYELEVSKSPAFNNKTFTKILKESDWRWKKAVPGKAYWRVRAVAKKDRKSPYSSVGTINAVLPNPEITGPVLKDAKVDSPEKLDAPGPPIGVQWPSRPRAHGYIVHVAKTPKFRKLLIKKKVKTPQAEFKLKKSGIYALRVASASEKGQAISSFSSPVPIKFRKSLKLQQPAPLQPQNEMNIVKFDSQKTPVSFRWEPSPHAAQYRLQLSEKKSFNDPKKEFTSSSPQLLIKKKLSGRLFWRVRAEYKKYTSPWSPVRSFSIQTN